jgi:hypothetical protein
VKIGNGAESLLDVFVSILDAGCYDRLGIGDPQSIGLMFIDALDRRAHSSFGLWVDRVVVLVCKKKLKHLI